MSEAKPLSDAEISAAVHEPDPCTKIEANGDLKSVFKISSKQLKRASYLQDFIMQQTMLRIKDPKKSLEFYTKVLGMRLLAPLHFPSMKFSLYFMGFEDPKSMPSDLAERKRWLFTRPATIELTHNWGTENDPSFTHHNGNSDPRGFGHIGIAVPDVYAASKRFEELGVEFVKRPDDGNVMFSIIVSRSTPNASADGRLEAVGRGAEVVKRNSAGANTGSSFAGKMKGLAFVKDPDGYWIEILNPNTVAS